MSVDFRHGLIVGYLISNDAYIREYENIPEDIIEDYFVYINSVDNESDILVGKRIWEGTDTDVFDFTASLPAVNDVTGNKELMKDINFLAHMYFPEYVGENDPPRLLFYNRIW